MDRILQAAQFAAQAHAGQKRKYNDLPFIVHPARVGGRTAILEGVDEETVMAAYLHDVVEDTPVTLDEIRRQFGDRVAKLVRELTNPSKGIKAPRSDRKRMDREHLTGVSREAKRIKLLDRIDNLGDLAGAPLGFLKLYLEESRLLVEVIGDADDGLRQELAEKINQLRKHCTGPEDGVS
jgi:(p)ppGpp synthase/HD superfamily hydrolase